MTGTKTHYIIPSAILLIILSAYTSNAQVTKKLVADETEIVKARGQSYLETVNSKIAYLFKKEHNLNRMSKTVNADKDTVYRVSFKQVDTNIVYRYFVALERRKIDLKRK